VEQGSVSGCMRGIINNPMLILTTLSTQWSDTQPSDCLCIFDISRSSVPASGSRSTSNIADSLFVIRGPDYCIFIIVYVDDLLDKLRLDFAVKNVPRISLHYFLGIYMEVTDRGAEWFDAFSTYGNTL
jgi:hypothetical protein